MHDQTSRIRYLNFNILGLQERAYIGVRRAAAFLGVSERFVEGSFPRSLTLGHKLKQQFLPDPYPEENIFELKENWKAWIIGNALRELDQFTSLFLDDAYDMAQEVLIFSGDYSPDYSWRRIEKITNVAEKHRRVLEQVGFFSGNHIEDQKCLVSLSHARNCLSHDLGVVTSKRTTHDAMIVRWVAPRIFVQQGDKKYYIDEQSMPFSLDKDGPEGTIMVNFEIIERKFSVGDNILFTPDDLLGMCHFYKMIIDKICQEISKYASIHGVSPGQVYSINL